MATPAARTIQKRYIVGSCTLDVELQLSALSQWYPQPIAQDLQFQLWMNDSAVGTGTPNMPAAGLIAQGDRATLQTLSQAVSQKVRGVLAIAHLNSPENNLEAARSQSATAQPIPELQLTRPLSYLQLCDISSVLYQCEQATPALPVLLSIATEPQAEIQTAVQTETQTRQNRLTVVPSVRPSESNPENSSSRQNNLIPFAAIRRRPQLWASSAAAALLAVGLTSTLWPTVQPSSQLDTATQSETASPEAANSKVANSKVANSDTDNRAARSNRNADTKPPKTGDSVAPAPRNAPAAGNSAPRNSPATGSLPENSATAPPTNATRAPERTAEGESSVSKQPAPTGSPNEPDTTTTSQSEPNAPAPAAPPPAADAPQSAAGYGTSPESARSRVADERFGNADNADAIAPNSANESTSAAASTETQALVQQASVTLDQVQNHFQSRWQAIKPAAVSETLSYEVQLSETGEVVSFVGLSEAAQAYRDRLLPADQPLIFPLELPPGSPEQSAGLTLQLDLLPDGQAQVQ